MGLSSEALVGIGGVFLVGYSLVVILEAGFLYSCSWYYSLTCCCL